MNLTSDELETEFEISDKTLMGYVEGRSMPSHYTVDILAHVLCVEPEVVVAACRRSQADADCGGVRTLGEWRRLREMTLEAVAVAADVCVPSLRKYEAGAIPRHKQAKTRLAKALGIGVRQIAWGEVDQAPAAVEANGSSAHHPLKNVA
jgi:transcriptional regulator with XRE-family HTH domain